MTRVAVTVGTFDGVHLGHRRLLATAAAHARYVGLELVVLTLDRHPLSLLRPERAPRLLTGLEHKLELLSAVDGVARAEVLVFDRARATQEPEAFVADTLAGELGARLLVVGANFRFGRGGAGDVALAEAAGAGVGLDVVGIRLVEGPPGTVISSSEIRRLVAAGRLGRAAELLGRPHEVRGVARPAGDGARSLALEVAVDPELLLPPPGRYAVLAGPLGERAPMVAAPGAVEGDPEGGASTIVVAPPPSPPPWWRPGVATRVVFEAAPAAVPAPAAAPGAAAEGAGDR